MQKTFSGEHAPRPPNKINGKIIILFKVLFRRNQPHYWKRYPDTVVDRTEA